MSETVSESISDDHCTHRNSCNQKSSLTCNFNFHSCVPSPFDKILFEDVPKPIYYFSELRARALERDSTLDSFLRASPVASDIQAVSVRVRPSDPPGGCLYPSATARQQVCGYSKLRPPTDNPALNVNKLAEEEGRVSEAVKSLKVTSRDLKVTSADLKVTSDSPKDL